MEDIVLLGGGGHARVVIDLITSASDFRIVGIVDKGLPKGTVVNGYEVLGDDTDLEDIFKNGIRNACVAVGSVRDNNLRKALYERAVRTGYRCPPLIHHKALVADGVSVGNGAQVMAGAIVQTGVRVGNNTIINTGTIVDHDCTIGNHVHIGPGSVISGSCVIGDQSFIGVGSTIIQGIKIENDSFIKAGSVIVKDVYDNLTMRGIPGR